MHPLLRPRWLLGHVLAVAAIVGFVFLGMWQLRRHDEKVALRDSVEAAMEAPPVAIEEVPVGSFSRVTAEGEYANVEAKVLRSRNGVSGYEVLTPLLLADGSAVLTDRGWARLDVDHRQGGSAPPGVVEVEGILWPAEKGAPIPDEMPEFVRRIDPAVFATFTDLEFRDEYLVVIDQSPPFGVVLRASEIGRVSLGPHLGYAGQWILFSGVVLVGYPLLLRRRSGHQRGSASSPG